ncbi:MAG: radical SAM protein [Spirochaetes bacterium]|nr:radical SAM protein [Spirochaetota bacterium]
MNNKCNLCNFKCGIDRSEHTGRCGLDNKIYVSHYGLHRGEEPFFTGNRGSGTIFFSGCTLRCRFCQNFQISRWRISKGLTGVDTVSVDSLIDIFYYLKSTGASNINLVSPTPYADKIREAITKAKAAGFNLPFIYNSHGYDSPETVESLSGLIDIYLPDMKYGDDSLAKNFSHAPRLYTEGKECIKNMYNQAGILKLDSNGSALKGIVVRHLVIPGHIESTFQVLDFLESIDRKIHISLMSQYHPFSVNRDKDFPELNRTLGRDEYKRVVDYAVNLGFKNLLIQGLDSHTSHIPDFNSDGVFEE